MSLFSLSQKLLFAMDAESAHQATVAMLKKAPGLQKALLGQCLSAPREVMGLKFPNPVGVAAGLDKNGECIEGLFGLGFGFVEVGTVTPRPQDGNPKPRVFRLVEDQAIINRLGFNNRGVDYLCTQVARARKRGAVKGPLGINIGKNATTPMEHAVDDYLRCLDRVYPLADYVTINISSPNTKNLRDLQSPDQLRKFIATLVNRGEQLAVDHGRRPIVLKVSPDNSPEQLVAMAKVIRESGIDGVIATNTTISRPALIDSQQRSETGGLSGRPLGDLALRQLVALRSELGSEIPIIGVGGIHDKVSAQARLAAGANLLQVYTGFVYRGPALLREAVDAARAQERRQKKAPETD